MDYIIRIPPFQYLHVKDSNTNVVSVVTGPTTFTCLDHQKVVLGPVPMIIIPPDHYVVIENPTIRKGSDVVVDEHGQPVLRYGDKEIRFEQPPFHLYDGEKAGPVSKLMLVDTYTALKLRALRDFEDKYDHKRSRNAGEEWLFEGRRLYYPQVEVEILSTIKAVILKSHQALKVRAIHDCKDYEGKNRKAGEEWLVRTKGAYLPSINEEVVGTINGRILTDSNALHVQAKTTFTDANGIERKAGSEWLVTSQDTDIYIPDVNEEITKEVQLIELGPHDFCVIKNPVEEGEPQLGKKKLVKGKTCFFLQPGESLQANIQQSLVLAADAGLWLTATEGYVDTYGGGNTTRKPGDVWLITGPGEYFYPLEAKIQTRTRALIAIESLGIYVFRPIWIWIAVALFAYYIYTAIF